MPSTEESSPTTATVTEIPDQSGSYTGVAVSFSTQYYLNGQTITQVYVMVGYHLPVHRIGHGFIATCSSDARRSLCILKQHR
jgi:hypothetical protein